MKWENIKYKERNNWKKYLYWLLIWLVWNVSLNKDHLWDYACDYQEGPHALCNGSSRGARVELLLQVGDPHLYFLVKFYDLICYWCDMWIIERWILGERRKVCVMMSIFLDSILNICVFKMKGCCVNCQVMKLSLTNEIWEV
jgi:hypothetical protein